jgi:hypothetical protein
MNLPRERISERSLHILIIDQHIRLEGAYQITKNRKSVEVILDNHAFCFLL